MDRIRGECFDFSEKAEKVLEENEEVLSEVEKHNLKLLAYETRTCYKGIDMKVFTYMYTINVLCVDSSEFLKLKLTEVIISGVPIPFDCAYIKFKKAKKLG